MNLEEAVELVFAAPLDRFVAERNRVAKELGDAGDKEAATAVKALRKPTVSVWALNQLARTEPEGIEHLAGLHEQLVSTGGGSELRRVTDERRRVIARLSERAAELLDSAGHPASATTTQRISQTLLAASGGEALAELRSGRLTRELESPGFGAMSGFEDAAQGEPYTKPDRRARERAEELARRATEAESEAADLRAAATAAEREAKRLATELARAERRAEAARTKADEALDRLDRG